MNAITTGQPVLTCDGPLLATAAVDPKKGTCFCGAVEIEIAGAPAEMGYCHCSACRSYSGNPMTAFKLFKADDVRVTRGAGLIGSYNRTEMSHRKFCKNCGGHIMTSHPGMGFTDVHAGILPGVPFEPVVHLNYGESVLRMKDGLPKLRDFPAQVGGSGELLPE